MTTRIGTILPGKKLDPWSDGMERHLPDGSDVVIVKEFPGSYGVLTLKEWHEGPARGTWYVHKDNIQVKGPHQ